VAVFTDTVIIDYFTATALAGQEEISLN